MRFRRRLSVAAFLIVALLGCPSVRAQDIHVSYTPPFVPIVFNVPFSAWTSTPQTFIFAVTPQGALTFYFTNLGAASHNIIATVNVSGNQNVADFSNNQLQWIGLPVFNPLSNQGSSSTQSLTIAGSHTVALISGINSGAQVALTLSGASNTTDGIIISAVLTPNGITGLAQVVGLQQAGTACNSPCFPVVIAGVNIAGLITVPGTDSHVGGPGVGWALADFTLAVSNFLSASSNNRGLGSQNGGNGNVPLAVNQVSNSTIAIHITTATTTSVGGTHSELKTLIVGTQVASATITIKDGGSTIGIITLPAAVGEPFSMSIGYACGAGCSIVTSAATDLTVIMSQ